LLYNWAVTIPSFAADQWSLTIQDNIWMKHVVANFMCHRESTPRQIKIARNSNATILSIQHACNSNVWVSQILARPIT